MKDYFEVLIIEDNHEHFELIERYVAEFNPKTKLFHADSLKSAYQIFFKNAPDLIISDWKLPDGEGIELLTHPEIKLSTPIVLMTSFGNEEYAVKAIKNGALDYIVKSMEIFKEFPHLITRFIKDWQNQKLIEIKEKELKKSEERLRNILESSPFGIFEIDSLYTIQYYNTTLTEMFHFEDQEQITFNKIFTNESEKLARKYIDESFINNSNQHFDCFLYRQNENFNAEVRLTPLTYSDSKNLLITIIDNTEKKRIEEFQLKENKLNSIGVLAGGIAHDFNNILSAILGNVSLAKFSMENNIEIQQLLADAEKACVRAKDLTQQLLTFSKGGAPIKQKTDITSIIKESAKFVVRGSNCFVHFLVDPDIHSVYVDKGQLSQVIQNIVINAIQSMYQGGQILIRTSNYDALENPLPGLKPEKYVRISIQDQGEGINEDDLKRIFDPYFTTKEAGNGLGLTICYSIIKQHNGMIEVLSEKSKGTHFNIYLPACIEVIKEQSQNEDLSNIENMQVKILVMDDDAMIRSMIDKILKRFKYEVSFAKEGNQLIDMYKSSIVTGDPFKIVLMDLTIQGGMGAKETLGILKNINPKIKCIVMSGYSTDPVVSNYQNYGFSDKLNKPFSINDLLSKIQKHLKD